MNTFRRIGLAASYVIVSGTSLAAPPARAACQQSPPLEVIVHLDSERIVWGEPIIARYRITNQSNSSLNITFQKGSSEWLSFELLDERGQSLPIMRPLVIDQGGVSFGAVIQPGRTRTGSAVASICIYPPGPGRYLVRARVRLPYHEDASAAPVRRISMHDKDLPLTVRTQDRAQLYRAANALRATILRRESGVNSYEMAIEALMSMPLQFTMPVWRQLLNSTALDKLSGRGEYIVLQLERFGTPGAVTILGEIWNRRRATGWRSSARGALMVLYRLGDAALAPQIRAIFGSREGGLPKGLRRSTAPDFEG